MSFSMRLGLLILGMAAIFFPLSSLFHRSEMPLALEFIGLTNASPTDTRLPLWKAHNGVRSVAGLTPASPSHALFELKNCTRSTIAYQPMTYQFTDSLPAGTALPKAPYRERGGIVGIDPARDRLSYVCSGLIVSHGMQFGPPPDGRTWRTLGPGEAALVALPRPPFGCVWRAGIGYGLPLTKSEILLGKLKRHLHIQEKWNINSGFQGPVYDEWMYGRWITNNELNPRAPLNAAIGAYGVSSALLTRRE